MEIDREEEKMQGDEEILKGNDEIGENPEKDLEVPLDQNLDCQMDDGEGKETERKKTPGKDDDDSMKRENIDGRRDSLDRNRKRRKNEDRESYYSDSESDPRQKYKNRSRERYEDRYRGRHKDRYRDRYDERYDNKYEGRYRDSYRDRHEERYPNKYRDNRYKSRYYDYQSDDSYEEKYKYDSRRSNRKYYDDEKYSKRDRRRYKQEGERGHKASHSSKDAKVKGRGAKYEQGLRSWDDKFVKTNKNEKEKEVVDDNYKINEDWIRSGLNEFENKFRSKVLKIPKWTHDKFEKINRESESEESPEREAVRMSPPLRSDY